MQLLAVHLSAHSDYSLLGSVCRVESLVKQAAKLGIEALALTDHNTTAGHGELERYCRLAGIKPIFGLELDLAYQKRTSPVIVLALSDAGYSNLLQLASLPGPVGRGDFLVHKDGLALLAGGPRGELMRLVAEGELDQAKGLHAWYEREFGSNYYIHHELGQELDIFALFPEEKFVMCQDVRYLEAPSLLTLEVLGKIKGGEGSLPPHPLLSWPELCKAFQGPDKVVQQTLALAKRCNAKLPRERTLPPHPSGASLPDVTWQKAKERFGHLTEEVVDRLNQELSIIKDLGYEDYFLIVADIVRFAKDAKIAVGPGRGSSASSLVAYVLGITEVDPLSWGLLFERFLNAERRTRPDIDLDFCYERRGEVLSYVLERFGQEHVAQIGTYGTFGPKAAAQEVRRILGQDNPAVERDLQGLKRHRSTHAAGVISHYRQADAGNQCSLSRSGDPRNALGHVCPGGTGRIENRSPRFANFDAAAAYGRTCGPTRSEFFPQGDSPKRFRYLCPSGPREESGDFPIRERAFSGVDAKAETEILWGLGSPFSFRSAWAFEHVSGVCEQARKSRSGPVPPSRFRGHFRGNLWTDPLPGTGHAHRQPVRWTLLR